MGHPHPDPKLGLYHAGVPLSARYHAGCCDAGDMLYPDTVKNTDGFDPGQSNHVLLAYSYISTGDDHVAIKARGKMPSYALSFLHNHFGYGHGMSIGSDIESGVH